MSAVLLNVTLSEIKQVAKEIYRSFEFSLHMISFSFFFWINISCVLGSEQRSWFNAYTIITGRLCDSNDEVVSRFSLDMMTNGSILFMCCGFVKVSILEKNQTRHSNMVVYFLPFWKSVFRINVLWLIIMEMIPEKYMKNLTEDF